MESTSRAVGAGRAQARGHGAPIPRWPGHPIFGHLTAFRRDRIGMLLGVAKTHPEIVEMRMGVIRRFVVITSPSLANEVLSTKQGSFAKTPGLAIFMRPVLGEGLLTSERAVHERQRRLLAPAFAHKRIAAYATTMGERAARLATSLEDGKEVDLGEAMMRLTFEIVGKTLFDADVVGDATAVGEALTTAMEVAIGQLWSALPVPPMIPTPQNLRYKRAVARLDEVVFRIIRERREQGGDRGDVLSMLIEAKDEDGTKMTDRQIRDEAMTLAIAGHETTANALAWTFYLLARHPAVRERMESELDRLEGPRASGVTQDDLKKLPYTLAIFKEAMRLYPPAYMVGRKALEDVAIGDHIVKKGSIVAVNIIGLHRRDDLWPDPETFDPERFLGDREKQLPRCAYMPFGAGPRVCIGNHFALMESHVLLATIARHLRFELTSTKPVEYEPLVTLRPKGGIFARAVVRHPA
jgi:cytochrome P450